MTSRRHVGLVTLVLAVATATGHSYATYARWSSSQVTFYINPVTADMSPAAAIAATQFALNVWNTQGASPFRFEYGGTNGGTVTANDGRNVVMFRNATSGSAIASTYSWWDGSNRLIDSDVVVWDAGFTFFTSTSGCGGTNGAYLEDILTHEFGHALGLNHSSAGEATMYPSYSYCSQEMRTLASDDVAGIQSLYGVSSTAGTTGGTMSPDGTTVPNATQITDDLGAVWTIGASGAILRNGVQAAAGRGSIILWTHSTIYVLGTDNNWWQWAGSGWINVGPQLGGTTGGTISPDGTTVPDAPQITDNLGAVWTISASGAILRNGLQAAAGRGSRILWTSSTIYVLGTDNNWWQWAGSGWINVGPQPGGTTGGITSPDGTTVPDAPQITDNLGAVWTIGASGAILRNGVQAAAGRGSRILWTSGTIYGLGTDNNWWRWTGSGWIIVGPQLGGTTPGTTSADGTTVPGATQITDNLGAVWTISASGAILRNGIQAAAGRGSRILWTSSTIYVLGTDNNWWRWTGSGWINVGQSVGS